MGVDHTDGPWGKRRPKVLSLPLWRSWLRREKDWRVQDVDHYQEHREYRALNRRYWRGVKARCLLRQAAPPILAAVVAGALYGTFMRLSPWDQITTLRHVAAFPNCGMARLVGLAPAFRGSPGYYESHDRDRDGWACEPLPRR